MTALEAYIEDVGLFYERFGLPKMAGRMIGYLMAIPSEKVSFDDIRQQLRASKGSVSSNINLLLNQRLIEKFMIPGDRKSYFRFSSRTMFRILDDKLNATAEVREIFSRANTLNTDHKSAKRKQLEEIIDFYAFMESELPRLKERWKKLRERLHKA